MCPCTGEVSEEQYAPVAAAARAGLTSSPGLLIGPLRERMGRLATEERFEEAAQTRDRLTALIDAIARQRRLDRIRSAALIEVSDRAGNRYEFRRGRLTRFWADGGAPPSTPALPYVDPGRAVEAVPDDPGPPSTGPLRPDLTDELLISVRWLDRHSSTLTLRRVIGPYADCAEMLPDLATGVVSRPR